MDKTEEQIAADKEAVEAMKKAQSNMKVVLERIATLEQALRSAMGNISTLKGYIPPNAYVYPHSSTPKRCTEIADDAMAAIVRVLG